MSHSLTPSPSPRSDVKSFLKSFPQHGFRGSASMLGPKWKGGQRKGRPGSSESCLSSLAHSPEWQPHHCVTYSMKNNIELGLRELGKPMVKGSIVIGHVVSHLSCSPVRNHYKGSKKKWRHRSALLPWTEDLEPWWSKALMVVDEDSVSRRFSSEREEEVEGRCILWLDEEDEMELRQEPFC